MRLIFALTLLASPAAAWDFTPGLPCLLTHSAPAAEVQVTHDPIQPLWSITLTKADPWAQALEFSITFDGVSPLTIRTNRHFLSEDGRSLTVTDRGFGNVVRGLIAGGTATARLGDQVVTVSLAGAADPTRALAACEEPATT